MPTNGIGKFVISSILALIFAAFQGLSFWVLNDIRAEVRDLRAVQDRASEKITSIDLKVAGIVTRHDLEDKQSYRVTPQVP